MIRSAPLEPRPVVAIVDVCGSAHARAVASCGRLGHASPRLHWICPDLTLPDQLRSLGSVNAVSVPIGIRGTSPTDRFLLDVAQAIESLRQRGVPVFVAVGSDREVNLLAQVPGSISVGPLRQARHRAQLRCSDLGTGSSGAALRAASLCAVLRTRRLRFSLARR